MMLALPYSPLCPGSHAKAGPLLGKMFFFIKKMISTSEWHAEHPFAGQNTQHTGYSQNKLYSYKVTCL